MQLDAGACDALLHRGASLLQVGITAVHGSFEASRAVTLLDPDARRLGVASVPWEVNNSWP